MSLLNFWTDDSNDHHEESSQEKHEHGFGPDAEKMIKNVKHAIQNGEGCQVCYLFSFIVLFNCIIMNILCLVALHC